MSSSFQPHERIKAAHSWLKKIRLAFVPGPTTPLLDEFVSSLLGRFGETSHTVLSNPGEGADVILTTATFDEPLNWRHAMLFTARQRYRLEHAPIVFTILHLTPQRFHELLKYFETVLAKEPPDPADFVFPGLAAQAYQTLVEQGRRGGPILSVARLLQSQTLCIRIILVVGEDRPEEAYTFDLVGAHPRSDAGDLQIFYDDLLLRIVTAASTREITDHVVVGDPIPLTTWQSLSTPNAMRQAGLELGMRHFFTEMVRVANLVNVPAVPEAVASQYSEGCFATWDPNLEALLATVTGSARPIEKYKLADDDLAVIVGVRPDGLGAHVRHVEGKRNDPPSSESVEMMQMDAGLPKINLEREWGLTGQVPVARSKLHGHRGVKSFDPQWVEHVPLDEPYYRFPVSCSTDAQARAILATFSRSEALMNPSDPRHVAFTVLPGHGVVLVEKWVTGKQPFQLIWEFMDNGILGIDNHIPQGVLWYQLDPWGKMVLQER
jgi:hypothetical protein